MVEIVWALKLYVVEGETADTGRTSLNDLTQNLRPQVFRCRHGVLFGGVGALTCLQFKFAGLQRMAFYNEISREREMR